MTTRFDHLLAILLALVLPNGAVGAQATSDPVYIKPVVNIPPPVDRHPTFSK